jgi:hypothetical protein
MMKTRGTNQCSSPENALKLTYDNVWVEKMFSSAAGFRQFPHQQFLYPVATCVGQSPGQGASPSEAGDNLYFNWYDFSLNLLHEKHIQIPINMQPQQSLNCTCATVQVCNSTAIVHLHHTSATTIDIP